MRDLIRKGLAKIISENENKILKQLEKLVQLLHDMEISVEYEKRIVNDEEDEDADVEYEYLPVDAKPMAIFFIDSNTTQKIILLFNLEILVDGEEWTFNPGFDEYIRDNFDSYIERFGLKIHDDVEVELEESNQFKYLYQNMTADDRRFFMFTPKGRTEEGDIKILLSFFTNKF